MNRQALLSGLFALSTLLCRPSHAQEKRAVMRDTFKTERAQAKPTTAVLLIKGPEGIPQTKSDSELYVYHRRIESETQEMILFDKVFADYPHKIVGGPLANVLLADIDTALNELACEADEFVIFIDMHGIYKLVKTPVCCSMRMDILEKYTNRLCTSPHDKDWPELTSDQLFGYLGHKFRKNPDFKNKTSTLIYTPCNGMSGVESTAFLTPGSKVVITSSTYNYTYDQDKAAYMRFLAPRFQKSGGYQLHQENVISEILYCYNMDTACAKLNDLYLVSIENRPCDTVTLNRKKIPIGQFGATVIDCSRIAETIETYGDSALFAMTDRATPGNLSRAEVMSLRADLKAEKGTKKFDKLPMAERGIANKVAWQIAEADPKQRCTVADYLQENYLITGIKKPRSETPQRWEWSTIQNEFQNDGLFIPFISGYRPIIQTNMPVFAKNLFPQ